MAEIQRTSLFEKLNNVGYKSLEGATVFCKLRGNPYVELVHWFRQMLQYDNSDLFFIVRHFSIDSSRLTADMIGYLDRLPGGASSISDLSSRIDELMEQAWLYTTLFFKDIKIRTGYLIIAALKTKSLTNEIYGISSEFKKLKVDELIDSFRVIVKNSNENYLSSSDDTAAIGAGAAPGESSEAVAPAMMGKQEALKKYAINLTERAKKGEIDPVLGRDQEIRQIVDILMRRRQNNPILTGDAGVGKTAVVDGLALRIAKGDVPPPLKNVSIRVLDIGLLQAGASMKGEFENRLRQVIEEVQASEHPIILFIDEAHTLIGAGGVAGTGDAANLLKPALARGQLRTIAATTWGEYKKHIEKDPALTRRFQVVKIDEPTEEKALLMMRGIAAPFEKHHKVLLLDEALEAAVKLSHRYISGRQLPDKAVSLIDTACARVAVSQYAVPPAVENSRRKIETLETELGIVDRETSVGYDHDSRREEILKKIDAAKSELRVLEENWQKEKALVDEILELRKHLRIHGEKVDNLSSPELSAEKVETGKKKSAKAALKSKDNSKSAMLANLKRIQARLEKLQGENPLILPAVDANVIGAVISDWTGIPAGRMVKDEISSVIKLSDTLEKRVIGQRHAIDAITKRIQTSRAGMGNPGRPIGVFMLVGPSGVGKTESALALAEALYGGEHNLITINMSEFQEAYTVSTLKGAPPGYVGYGEGGVLTEAVRRKPYSVILLDEVEKAHHDVHEIFYQVFDKGMMEDGEGREIDFKNTVILLTTNVGSDLIMNMCKDPEIIPEYEALEKALRQPLLKVFPAAFLGRLSVVPYYPISDGMLSAIIKLQLSKIKARMAEDKGIQFVYDDSVIKQIAKKCTEFESGARMVDAILTHNILPEISNKYLMCLSAGKEIKKVTVKTDGKENFVYKWE